MSKSAELHADLVRERDRLRTERDALAEVAKGARAVLTDVEEAIGPAHELSHLGILAAICCADVDAALTAIKEGK